AQSGGLVTQTLIYLMKKKEIRGALVVQGISIDDKYTTNAYIATTPDEIINSQHSKYIPTNLLVIAKKIEKLDYPIAVVGLSCHIHGLDNLINKNNRLIKNLKSNIKYKFGLICDGLFTYAAIDYFENKSKITKIYDLIFRDKHNNNYIDAYTNIKGRTNNYLLKNNHRFQLKEIIKPPRCKICFDKMNIFADISFGDPWGIEGYDKKLGDSLIITRNKKGNHLIDKMLKDGAITAKIVSYSEAVNGQKINFKKSEVLHFTEAYKSLGFKIPFVNEMIIKENNININANNKFKAQKYISTFLELNKKDRKKIIKYIEKKISFNLIINKIKYIINKLLRIIYEKH
ncbi:hypothetical protein TI05_19705, partial [Achromatium sp. WMS3]